MNPEDYGFQPHDREPFTIEDAVYQTIGAASVCWDNPGGAGVFESDRARELGRNLMRFIQDTSE